VRLLVTRQESDARRTAGTLRARGHDVIVAPLLRIETVGDAALGAGPWSAVLMTSANAARVIAAFPQFYELRAAPVFAVGQRTADAARVAGFADVRSAEGDAKALARLVGAEMGRVRAPLLYLAGEDRAGDLAGEVQKFGLAVQTTVIYRAVAASTLPGEAREALTNRKIDGVLHFSQRSAEIYLDVARAAGVLDRALAPFHYCLSAQVARPLAAAGATRIRIASRPEEAALIELIGAA
jgi:uroporphyrinogen-III synthase